MNRRPAGSYHAGVKTPAVLVDDPRANDEYDLPRALADWSGGVAAVIEPLRFEAAGDAASGAALGPSDSETTRGLKTARVRYRLRPKGGDEREFGVEEGPQVLQQLGQPALLLVCFVSAATFPLIMRLAQHEATRSMLRVGITGVRMDGDYNLARKLIVDGGIAYHEHTRVLDKVLCHRLELMQRAHVERLRATPG